VLLALGDGDADASGYEPVTCDGRRIGYVTSGAYGHHVQQSLALAYVEASLAAAPVPLSVAVIGAPRAARILRAPPYDPQGRRLRG